MRTKTTILAFATMGVFAGCSPSASGEALTGETEALSDPAIAASDRQASCCQQFQIGPCCPHHLQ